MKRIVTICAFVVIILSAACSTCPPCVPTHEVTEVRVPVYYCPDPPVLEAITLPPWPVLADNPTPDEIKEWYIAMQATVKLREAVCAADGVACREYLDSYRTTE